jgi:Capsule assembly protein Wzi
VKRIPCLMAPAVGLLALLLGGSHDAASAQSLPVGDAREEYLRVLQVAGLLQAGSFTVRPLHTSNLGDEAVRDPWGIVPDVLSRRKVGDDAWIAGWGAEAEGYLNSAFPYVENDGSIWQGKGLTLAAQAGGSVGFGPLTLSVRPTVVYAQNQDFPLARPDRPEPERYRNPWHGGIDLPQRFGPDAVSFVDPGQTSLRLSLGSLSVGAGTENLWWGPGVRNALLMTNNAAGFPHADIRTDKPLNLGIGTLEAQWLWGRPSHSDWFDEARTPESRFFTGAVLAFTPKGVPGLTLGAARVFQFLIDDRGIGVGDYFLVFQSIRKKKFDTPSNPGGQDDRDQLASVFARWVLPESGFEVYGEWGRNDHSADLREYFVEPEHSSAYIVGFRKVSVRENGRILSVNGEVAHLERGTTRTIRATPTWYDHGLVLQGYTQEGQVIGAGVGPGGNSQYLGFDLFRPGGRLGGFVQRRVTDNDAFYNLTPPNQTIFPHHVSLDLGGRWSTLSRGGEFEITAVLTRDFNRYFVEFNDVWNAHIEAAYRWRMH